MTNKLLLRTAEKLFYIVAAGWGVYLFATAFCFSAYKIPSGSMLPNIQAGVWIGVDKAGYGSVVRLFGKEVNTPKFRDIKRGDVIVFHFPEGDTVLVSDPAKNFYEVKRWLMFKQKLEDMPLQSETVHLPISYRLTNITKKI